MSIGIPRVQRVNEPTSSSFSIFSMILLGKGDDPTVKYVGNGMGIFPVMRSVTVSSASVSSASAKRFPATIARAKLFLSCSDVSLVKTLRIWPFTSPRTIL